MGWNTAEYILGHPIAGPVVSFCIIFARHNHEMFSAATGLTESPRQVFAILPQ